MKLEIESSTKAMKLAVESCGRTTMKFQVEPSDPINNNVKVNLEHKELKLQTLFRLSPMKIFVKTEAGNTFTFEVESSHTIGNLKAKIQKKEGTPLKQQRLVFNEKELMNDQTLGDHDIQNESMVTLLRVVMQIAVKGPFGDDVSLGVKPSNTVGEVKGKYLLKVGYGLIYLSDAYGLKYNGRVLEDEQSLAHYNIQGGSSLYLFDCYSC